MSRPEHIAPPDIFYNEQEAQKYGYKYVYISIYSLFYPLGYLLPINNNVVYIHDPIHFMTD